MYLDYFFLFWRHLFGSLSSKLKISHKMHRDLRLRCIKTVPEKIPPPFSSCTRCLLQLLYFENFLIYHTYICNPSSQGSNVEILLKILSKEAFEDENEKVVLILQLRVSSVSTYDYRSFKRHGDKRIDTIYTHDLGGAV